MSLIELAKLNCGLCAYGIFYLSYTSLGEDISDDDVQNMYRFWELTDVLPETVREVCLDIIKGNRDIQPTRR